MEEIQEKANYCLNCKVKPCSLKGCPLNNNIPNFIKEIKEELDRTNYTKEELDKILEIGISILEN